MVSAVSTETINLSIPLLKCLTFACFVHISRSLSFSLYLSFLTLCLSLSLFFPRVPRESLIIFIADHLFARGPIGPANILNIRP